MIKKYLLLMAIINYTRTKKPAKQHIQKQVILLIIDMLFLQWLLLQILAQIFSILLIYATRHTVVPVFNVKFSCGILWYYCGKGLIGD